MKTLLLFIYFYHLIAINILIDKNLQTYETNNKTSRSIESALEQNINESDFRLALLNVDTLVKNLKIFQKSIYIL